jgi:hypothetical protein
MLDIDGPDALPELRRVLVAVGLDPSGLRDDEVRIRERVKGIREPLRLDRMRRGPSFSRSHAKPASRVRAV